MKNYIVEVEGRDILTDFGIEEYGPDEPFGCLTTRFVRARDEKAAEEEATRLVREELASMGVASVQGGAFVLWVNKVEEVDAFPRDIEPPGSGFGWFPQRAEEA